MSDQQGKGASLRDRAGGLRPEPATQSQPEALIPSAVDIRLVSRPVRAWRFDDISQGDLFLGLHRSIGPIGNRVNGEFVYMAISVKTAPNGALCFAHPGDWIAETGDGLYPLSVIPAATFERCWEVVPAQGIEAGTGETREAGLDAQEGAVNDTSRCE